MSQTLRAWWPGAVALAVMLAGAQSVPAHAATAQQSAAATPQPAQAAAQQAAAVTPTNVMPYVDGNVQAGAAKAAVCAACHGVNGNSTNPQWPTLAGQSAVYIAQQLLLFRAGVRDNPIMMPMAKMLSDQDIDNLAVYFAAQTPKGLEADPSYWQAGQALYRDGDPAHQIPACIACHGPVGRGNPAAGYPALRAQHSVYVVEQLKNYASGKRYAGAADGKPASPHAVFMQTIAKRLTAEDIRDLASYIQGMR